MLPQVRRHGALGGGEVKPHRIGHELELPPAEVPEHAWSEQRFRGTRAVQRTPRWAARPCGLPVATGNRRLWGRAEIKAATLPGMPRGSPRISSAETEPASRPTLRPERPRNRRGVGNFIRILRRALRLTCMQMRPPAPLHSL